MLVAVGETVVLGNTVVKATLLYQVAVPELHEAESTEDWPAHKVGLEAETVGRAGMAVTLMVWATPVLLQVVVTQAA